MNVTSLDEECPDDECILHPSDFRRLTKPSAVAFSRARIWDSRKIDDAIAKGLIQRPHPNMIPARTIAKVIAAALIAKELSQDKKDLL